MKRIIAFQTILGWINSSKDLGELAVASEAIGKIYDPKYREANEQDSDELYYALYKQVEKIRTQPTTTQPIDPQKTIANDNN